MTPNSDGTPLVYFEFDRDAVGDIISSRRENADVVYYSYDAVRRLTGETWRDSGGSLIYGFEWDYDAAGNRLYQMKNMAVPVGSGDTIHNSP
jgi:YD repeat-containing protein